MNSAQVSFAFYQRNRSKSWGQRPAHDAGCYSAPHIADTWHWAEPAGGMSIIERPPRQGCSGLSIGATPVITSVRQKEVVLPQELSPMQCSSRLCFSGESSIHQLIKPLHTELRVVRLPRNGLRARRSRPHRPHPSHSYFSWPGHLRQQADPHTATLGLFIASHSTNPQRHLVIHPLQTWGQVTISPISPAAPSTLLHLLPTPPHQCAL